MKNQTLVLFCGGPAIYPGALPKPLQTAGDQPLIGHYLRHAESQSFREIVLLSDQSFSKHFETLLDKYQLQTRCRVLACEDESSTLKKLERFLHSADRPAQVVQLSYPDLFFTGDLKYPEPEDPRLDEGVFISVAPLISRFPRLIVDIYSGAVKGISNHSSPTPANPMHVFGGHLLGRVGVLKAMLQAFLRENESPSPSLEFDMFFWLINQSKVNAMVLDGDWTQVDSPRDIARLLRKLSLKPTA